MNIYRKLIQTKQWKFSVVILIGLCAIYLGLEVSETYNWLFKNQITIIDIIFTLLFSFEIIIRILAEDKSSNFFKIYKIKNGKISFYPNALWNIFDLLLVFGSMIAILISYQYPEFFLVGRLLRAGRVFRLFDISESLKDIEKQIVRVFPTIIFFLFLLTVLLYTYAVVGTHLFGNKSLQFRYIESSLITVIQLLTMDGWSDVMKNTMKHYGVLGFVYCVSFIFQIGIIFLNVFIAVLVKNVEKNIEKSNEKGKQKIESIELLEKKIILMEQESKIRENEILRLLKENSTNNLSNY